MIDPVFEIPSDPKYLKSVSDKVLNALEGLNLSADILFDIRLCLEEAVINAMKYGNKFDKSLPVVISYTLSEGRLELKVRDRGKGFDHTVMPDPRIDANIIKNGGRGLFLIKSLMDEVEFNNSGNEIKMIKFISGGNAHGDKG